MSEFESFIPVNQNIKNIYQYLSNKEMRKENQN